LREEDEELYCALFTSIVLLANKLNEYYIQLQTAIAQVTHTHKEGKMLYMIL
jgi:hypothetical protein